MTTIPLIPLEVLFGNPERVSPQISPDGSRMAYIAPDEGVLNVWVGTTGKGDYRPVTRDRDRGIRYFLWAHDNRHLLYIQDQGGDENWRVYTVDLDTGEVRDRTPFEGVQARIEAHSKHFPHEVLIGLNKENPELHDVWRLDLRTGELTKRVTNPGFAGLVNDRQFQVRAAIAIRPDGGQDVHVRDAEDAEWRTALSFDPDDALASSVAGFTGDGKALFLISSKEANTARLVRFDIATGEQMVLAGDPGYDVSGVAFHPDTHEPLWADVLKERVHRVVLDPSVAGDLEALAGVQDGDFEIIGRDHSDRTWLAAYTTDDGPVSYYSFDRDTKAATFLFDHRPVLRGFKLAKMEPFSFTSRDGLTVHGYVTFPPGVERRDLPAVLNVHGGPWGRDAWRFDPHAQFFANRGYLCVQVNFRGSTGYGKEFLNAGDREWGARMHDDLIDAVEYVVAQGWADRERIAIFGGSYGGYAALVGATFTPDVFACAVDIVGPSSLKTLIETVPPYWQPGIALLHTRVGNPETDEEFLWSRSPLSKVDQIKIPMLIAQGANDPRVKQAESEQIVAAMKQKGIDHEYMLFPDEGHGFAKPENRLKFYAVAEKFLAKHLGGRAEAPSSTGGA
jgi:dipeptidyl aminopeptidase/acylaminoacyl peptidase